MHENKAHKVCRSIHMYTCMLDIIVFAELDGFCNFAGSIVTSTCLLYSYSSVA